MGAFEPRWPWAVYAGDVAPAARRSDAQFERDVRAALAWLRFAPFLTLHEAEAVAHVRPGTLRQAMRRRRWRDEIAPLRSGKVALTQWRWAALDLRKRRRNNLDRQARERQTAVNA